MMRAIQSLAFIFLSLVLVACSGVDIHSEPVDTFAAGNYKYYKWRTEPLPQNTHTSDVVYMIDPVLRREMNAQLQSKGYILDPDKAQFSVDYLQATGLRDGAKSEQASNISHIPSATINRQADQASVDNAIALGGVKETSNLMLQINDIATQTIVWSATLTKIVENANKVDRKSLDSNLTGYIERAVRPLPKATGTAP